MAWLWRAFEEFRTGYRKDSGHVECTKPKQLLDLPPELIISIADMLPTTSAACLALCSRRLSQILGPRAWTSLQRQEQDGCLAFISVLARDLPQHFVCYPCVRLHRSSTVPWPRVVLNRQAPKCVRMDVDFSYMFPSWYFITFAHVQLAMKRHYYGSSHGFPLEAFLYTEVNQTNDRGTTLLSVDTQIVTGELLMRSQQLILLPRDRSDEFFTKDAVHHICNHIWKRIPDDSLAELVRSRLEELEAQGKCCTQTLQCRKCYMDFTIDAIDFAERGIAVLVTRWINLGAGLHPEDAKWQSHLHISMPKGVVHQPHPLGRIRASFERQEGKSMEELTADNLRNLFSRREHRLVTRGSDELVWK